MPITVHLDELLEDQQVTLTELAERVGITVANLSILKTNKARAVRFSTLEAICRELACQPGDLISYNPKWPTRPTARRAPTTAQRLTRP